MTQTGHPRRWTILLVLILALFAVSLDNTILTIALPTLAVELGASNSELQWMVDAYILVFAGLLLVAGALSDRYGRRLLLVSGLVLFGLGSALAPLVTDATQLILLRGFMGLGAAMAMPSTLSILAEVFAPAERPKAIATWSAVSALGIVVGPILGGWLLEHFAWQSVFLVNIPFVVVGVAATLAIVPESRAPGRTPLDLLGAGLSVAGLVALVYGIIEIPVRGWDDPVIWAILGTAIVLLGAFVAWERRVATPMLDVRLFADRRFSAASLAIALVFFSLSGALFFLTQFLQGVLGLSAFETGLRFIPIAIGVVVAAPISATLTHRIGSRVTTVLGLVIVAVSLGLLATLGVSSGDLELGAVLMVVAIGIGMAMTPATDSIMSALPREQFGVGSAVNDTVREIGGALGVAVLGSVFAAGYAGRMSDAIVGLPAEVADAATGSLAGALAVAAQLGGEAGLVLAVVARDAFVAAQSMTSLIGVAFAIGGALIALAWMPDRIDRTGEATDAAGAEADARDGAVASAPA
jgi:EmrB/QacA subfamily drug resistance transporter